MADENLEAALDYATYDPDDVIILDTDFRTLKPNSNILFGVYNDESVHTLSFEIPRYYDSIDLKNFQIRVNIQNANGVRSAEEVSNVELQDNVITFDWPLKRILFEKAGTIKFSVCLKRFNASGELVKELNSTIATGTVLEGLEVDDVSTQSVLYRLRELRDRATAAEGVYVGFTHFTLLQLNELINYLDS